MKNYFSGKYNQKSAYPKIFFTFVAAKWQQGGHRRCGHMMQAYNSLFKFKLRKKHEAIRR
jgi:hypothetical protein